MVLKVMPHAYFSYKTEYQHKYHTYRQHTAGKQPLRVSDEFLPFDEIVL